jgi:hypothetical protein
MVKENTIEGINMVFTVGEDAWAEVLKGKAQVDETIRPYCQSVARERRSLTDEYYAEIIRADNYNRRHSLVRYSAFGVLAMSYLINKRGYFRYSLRNAFIYYAISSALICPENLNPFN